MTTIIQFIILGVFMILMVLLLRTAKCKHNWNYYASATAYRDTCDIYVHHYKCQCCNKLKDQIIFRYAGGFINVKERFN